MEDPFQVFKNTLTLSQQASMLIKLQYFLTLSKENCSHSPDFCRGIYFSEITNISDFLNGKI